MMVFPLSHQRPNKASCLSATVIRSRPVSRMDSGGMWNSKRFFGYGAFRAFLFDGVNTKYYCS